MKYTFLNLLIIYLMIRKLFVFLIVVLTKIFSLL